MYLIKLILFTAAAFGVFSYFAFTMGFRNASEFLTSIIGFIVVSFIALIIFGFLTYLYRFIKARVVRKADGTYDLSNEKFAELIMIKAQETYRQIYHDDSARYLFAAEKTHEDRPQFQALWYKFTNDELEYYEDTTGNSFGFGLFLKRTSVSGCHVNVAWGKNGIMKEFTGKATFSVDQAAQYIASKAKIASDKAAKKNAKSPDYKSKEVYPNHLT